MRYHSMANHGFLLAVFATVAVADDTANWVGKKVMVNNWETTNTQPVEQAIAPGALKK